MNRLNAKRIGVLAASLLFGLAVAGPVTFGNIQIINSVGQPVVQIVVGSTAQPSDGVVAANIAAVIGNLAFTSTPVTATVGNTAGLQCVVTTATCSISNQQVWLGESGVAAPSGTYGFTALIGSVLNRGVTLGSPTNTKTPQGSSTYAYQEGTSSTISTTASPLNSPYTALSSVPTSTSASASTNGGGLSFTSFTASGYDNILQISNAQLPALLGNAGANGESEYLWVTGFPVYDQQTSPSVQSFALIDTGGAYQMTLNKPIHEPYYSATNGGTSSLGGANTINNAQITILGQNWTIVSYTLPGSTSSSSTTAVHGGKLGLATSLVPLSTVYVGKNLTSGPFTVQLADLGSATSAGVSPAAINVYYKGALTNSSSIFPGNTVKYNITGTLLFVKVNQTFAGLYAYQKWAKMQLFSGVYNVSDGGVFNQTRDPGWDVNLYWLNTTGSGHYTDLYSVVIYNTTPIQTLLPGQSLVFIQNPQRYKVTLAGDTLGSNFDSLTVQSQFAGSVWYQNKGTNLNVAGIGNIDNLTEPAQELVVTSSIPNAFSYAGTTSSSVTYLLTPYFFNTAANAINANTAAVGTTEQAPLNVIVTTSSQFAANLVTSTYPLLVTITGWPTNQASSATSTVLTFYSANYPSASATVYNSLQATTTNFFNVTAIKLSRALPGLTVSVGTTANAMSSAPGNFISAGNTIATLTTQSPYILYPSTNNRYQYSLTSGTAATALQYNQQNGQPTTYFTITSASAVGIGPGGLTSYFTYNIPEYTVPASTSYTEAFSFNILNSTAGVSATPLFQLNYSLSSTHNNVTYIPSNIQGGGTVINARQGFVSERGSKVGPIGSSLLTFNLAEQVDTLQFFVGPLNTTTGTAGQKTAGPYSVGQKTNLPNVTIAQVNASCKVTGGVSGCTVSGVSNLTATPSVKNATTPVKLDTSTTPLAVLDTNANQASTLIVVGSKFVNSVAAQIFAQNPSLNSTFNTGSVISSAEGSNRILIAGYYANQTVAAGNQFIQALLSQA
jgi:hypothetical protein